MKKILIIFISILILVAGIKVYYGTLDKHLEVTPARDIYYGEEVTKEDFDAILVYENGTRFTVRIKDVEEYAKSKMIFNTNCGEFEADVDIIEVKSFECYGLPDNYIAAGNTYEVPNNFRAVLVYGDGAEKIFYRKNLQFEIGMLQHGENILEFKWHNITGQGIIKALAYPIIQSNEYPMYYQDLYTTIEITKERYKDTDCFVAHIITSDPLALRTAFAEGGYNHHQVMSEVMEANNAILMINGDFGDYGNGGKIPIVRNGEIVRLVDPHRTRAQTIGITTEGHFYKVEQDLNWEIENNHLRDCWTFNKGFVIFNGERIMKYNETKAPRTFIGEVLRDDGLLEYYLVVADGRRADSRGFSHDDESSFLIEKGCYIAYNLDGGGSSEMMFDGKILNVPSGGHERKDHDFIYFKLWEGT